MVRNKYVLSANRFVSLIRCKESIGIWIQENGGLYIMIDMRMSTQINDGLTQTSADGGCLCFDSQYGIMFCAYMPGQQGNYGESRNKIALSYFPASQPTNIKFIDISEDNDEYLPNINLYPFRLHREGFFYIKKQLLVEGNKYQVSNKSW